jgi:hypothetical protein
MKNLLNEIEKGIKKRGVMNYKKNNLQITGIFLVNGELWIDYKYELSGQCLVGTYTLRGVK